ncbi:MAG: type II asparaginase [Veillonellales bacterium]
MKKSFLATLAVICLLLCSFQVALAEEAPTPLPNVKILATGGTIAGSAASNTQMTGYKAGALGIDVLMNAVPQMKQYANVSGEQVCSISSNNMTDEIWLKIAKRVNELLTSDDVDGIVITHGTDTLEETAYFLNLVVKSDKPVVLVGAMRPATAISADGPVNLLNAVRLAASKDAWGKGVLIAMNDEINSARDATKTNTTHVDTFKAPELGCLGYINNGKPYFYRNTTRLHTSQSVFDITGLTQLPDVEIIYSHSGENRALVDAAVAAGAKGIIYAGTGNGSIHDAAEAGLIDAQKQGVVIVRSSRTGNGTVINSVPKWDKEHFLMADTLNPQKARILLMLALTKTDNLEEIQTMFNEY